MTSRLKLALLVAGLCAAAIVVALNVRNEVGPQLSWAAVNRAAVPAGNIHAGAAARLGIPLEPGAKQRHTHVAVRLSAAGSWWAAPNGLGINSDGKALAIHTHDLTAVVHLHQPLAHKPFTLRDILALWQLPVKGDTILGSSYKVFVNGRPASIGQPLHDRDDIIIQLSGGPELSDFDWQAVPLKAAQ
jgi:hypothetical protein